MLIHFLDKNLWMVFILLWLVIGLLVSWSLRATYARLLPRLQKTPLVWDDTLFKAIYKPLLFFLWLLLFSFILPEFIVQFHFAEGLLDYLPGFRELLFVSMTFWFLMRYISNVEQSTVHKIMQGHLTQDRTTVGALAQLMRIAVLILAILLGMQALNLPIATLLAAGGIGGLAISFAAKDTLANFLGGLMIFWDRPFSVGDWVRSPDRDIEGNVEYIGWRLTRIRTFELHPLYVPNGIFSSISVENPSRMIARRIKTSIGLRYEDAGKIGQIVLEIRQMLKNHPGIDQQQWVIVNFDEFAASSLNILLDVFAKTNDRVRWLEIQQDVFLKIIDIIASHEAECAFPTTTVNLPARSPIS